jgi:hypothetical protein
MHAKDRVTNLMNRPPSRGKRSAKQDASISGQAANLPLPPSYQQTLMDLQVLGLASFIGLRFEQA